MMTFDVETAYRELRSHFGKRVHRNELLARHCTFGVGGPADIWISLETQEELGGLVTLCSEQRWPLLLTGNGTNVLYADAGVRGIVARIASNGYSIEDSGDGTALLIASAGISWPRLLNELTPRGWGGLEFRAGYSGDTWRRCHQQCRCAQERPGASPGMGRRAGCTGCRGTSSDTGDAALSARRTSPEVSAQSFPRTKTCPV